jgi:hypothetical protein
LLAARGYSSATLFYEIAKERICPALEHGQDVVVLHLGDHDPSGLDMTRDLRDRLSLYARQGVDVRRVALNMNQVAAFKPPPNSAKESDKRHEAYRREYSDQCWELDALPPEELARLTREGIEEHIDWPQWGDTRWSSRKGRLAYVSSWTLRRVRHDRRDHRASPCGRT